MLPLRVHVYENERGTSLHWLVPHCLISGRHLTPEKSCLVIKLIQQSQKPSQGGEAEDLPRCDGVSCFPNFRRDEAPDCRRGRGGCMRGKRLGGCFRAHQSPRYALRRPLRLCRLREASGYDLRFPIRRTAARIASKRAWFRLHRPDRPAGDRVRRSRSFLRERAVFRSLCS